jgi:hypothetical protein
VQLVLSVHVELLRREGEPVRAGGRGDGRRAAARPARARLVHHEVADAEAVAVEQRQEPEQQHPAERRDGDARRCAGVDGVGSGERRHGQEHLHLAGEVSRDDRLCRERTTARVDGADPELALAGRLALPRQLEEREVEGADEEQRQQRGGHAEISAADPRHEDEDREHRGEHEEVVEQERSRAVTRERDREAQRHAVGGHDLARARAAGGHARLPARPR